jgi:hypothetical protein
MPTTLVAIPTADSIFITADTTDWLADGATLINGGGVGLPENTPKTAHHKLAVRTTEQVPPWYFPQYYPPIS